MIKSNRTICRPVLITDLELIMNWRMSPEVTSQMFTDPELTIEKQHEWHRKIIYGEDVYYTIEHDLRPCGLISFNDIDKVNHRNSISFYLSPDMIGSGLGALIELMGIRFSKNNLKSRKLVAEVLESNEKTIKLHKRFGFEIAGRRKNHIYKANYIYDVIEMDLDLTAFDPNQYSYIEDYFA